jgi:hypothetical protein
MWNLLEEVEMGVGHATIQQIRQKERETFIVFKLKQKKDSR